MSDTGRDSIPLPILTDRPEVDPGLGFESIVDAIVGIVRDNHASGRGFTIGVFGAWGSGKSSVLNGVESRLRDQGDLVVTRLEAWRYSQSKMLVVQLLKQMVESMEGLLEKGSSLRAAFDFASSFAGLAFEGLAALAGGDGSSIGSRLEGFMSNKTPDLDMSDLDLNTIFDEMRDKLKEAEKTAVVLIDDLDRCSPADIAQIIGTLNTLMDKERFIFVLALDRSYLVQAITQAYGLRDEQGNVSVAFGERFLEKVIQVPLYVPHIDFTSVSLDSFVGKEARETLGDHYAIGADQERCIEETIIPLALNSNPRQVKRFLNDYVIGYYTKRHEVDRLVDVEGVDRGTFAISLLHMIALRTASPTIYDRVIVAVQKSRQTDGGFRKIVGGVRTSNEPLVRQAFGESPGLDSFLESLEELDLDTDVVVRALEFSQVPGKDALSEWHSAVERFLSDPDKRRVYDDAVKFLNKCLKDQPAPRYTNEFGKDSYRERRPGDETPTAPVARSYFYRTPEHPFCTLTFMTVRDELRLKFRAGVVDEDQLKGTMGVSVEKGSQKRSWGSGDVAVCIDATRCHELPESVKGAVRKSLEKVKQSVDGFAED